MTQQRGAKPDDATKDHASVRIENLSDQPARISWQAKLAFSLLIGWTLFLSWIAFT